MIRKLQRIFEIQHFYFFPELVIYKGNLPNPMQTGVAWNVTCFFRRFIGRVGESDLGDDLTDRKML